jgi:hypothetical protein
MSLLFDGVNDWVDCRAGGAVVNWVNSATVAFMQAWAVPTAAGAIGHMIGCSINNGGVATPDSRMSLERSATGAIESYSRAGDGGAFQIVNDNGSGSLPAAAETLCSVRCNVAGDSVQIQRNGAQTVTAGVAYAGGAFTGTGSASASLGSDEDGSATFFGGRIEDARAYNRNVSDAEIQTIHACRGHDGIWSGITARYRCNEGAPGVAAAGAGAIKDVTNNQRHGTPTNGPTWQESRLSLRRRFP